MWLECHSVRDIGETLGMSKSDVDRVVSQLRESAELGQPPESRQHFDVWQFQTAAQDADAERLDYRNAQVCGFR
jgi:hypothetical protein